MLSYIMNEKEKIEFNYTLLIVEQYLNCARNDEVKRAAEGEVESKIGREVQIVSSSEIKCKNTSLIINVAGSYKTNT